MRKILIISCTSFTAMMLLFCLFSKFNLIPEVDNALTLQAFIVSLSIAILMNIGEKITDKLKLPSIWIDAIMRVLICYIVVFVEGVLFSWFPASLKSLLAITPILIIVFIVTYLVIYLTCVEYAEEINKDIESKKLISLIEPMEESVGY